MGEIHANVSGQVHSAFDPVRREFENLWQHIEVGASLCVFRHGELIVDLWGGYMDKAMSVPWRADTLVNIYSSTKGPAALAIAILHDQGKIDYNAPVADYWPEFGAEGKAAVTVAQALAHQGGVCGISTSLEVEDLYDWGKMTKLIAAQAPLWPLSNQSGYHAVTWGYLPGELVRRITGHTLGQFIQDTICKPLSADFFLGVPDTELSRCAELIGPNHARIKPAPALSAQPPTDLFPIALQNPSISPFKHACSSAWRKAEIAASNGHASARGLAKIYAALATGGGEIISTAALRSANHVEVNSTVDLVLGTPVRRSRGFMLNLDGAYGPNDAAFGHAGAGGSLGFADQKTGIGFAYVMNQMQADTTSTPRSKLLLEAVYACL